MSDRCVNASNGKNGPRETNHCYVAQFVPTDGEEFQWVDEHACAGDIPESKNNDGIHCNLLNVGCMSFWEESTRYGCEQTTYSVGT